MHVVLSGYYGFGNVGDEAILFSIIQALRELNPELKITILSNNPASTKETYHVDAVNRWNIREITHVIKKADGLISGGGSLLQDETGIKSIPYYTGIMKIAKWYKKPVFIYSQGMGPIKKGLSKRLVRNALNGVGTITVRDGDSKALLEKIGVKNTITVVPDPVLGLNGSTFESKWIKNQQINEPFITVSVRDWPTKTEFKKKIAYSLDQLALNGNIIVLVPMHGKQDEVASKDITDLMNEKSIITPGDLSTEEKISIIGQSKLLIGMRLHSLIFAAVNNVPFVAISYDPKIDAFATIFEQPVACHVVNDDWDGGLILDKVNRIFVNEIVQRELLENKVKRYQREAMGTPKLALELFSKS